MIPVKNFVEVSKMRESNRIVGLLLSKLESRIKPGISTLELDKFAEDLIRSEGGKPAFKGYSIPGLAPFPASICASVNSCIVHGIPSSTMVLREGDIIGVDVGVYKDGYYGDGARTYAVGEINAATQDLLNITKEALNRGIAQAKPGARIGDISFAIGSWAQENGYFIADSLTGHGIGRKLHEEPMIPNIGIKGMGPRLKVGMTLAIEPMINIGTNRVEEKGWEFFVADNTLSAHFEHTILIREEKAEILTVK
jgi:methionyl aminopeptidase